MQSSKTQFHPNDNFLLANLPDNVQERVFPLLVEVKLELGRVVYEADQDFKKVYFPTSCIISFLNVMLDGASSEISVVGNEGMVGIAVFMGGASTPSRAVVQSAGTAYCLSARDLQREFNNDASTRTQMLRYTQALITQMAQTAVCNRLHLIDQQFCRWLLVSLDRRAGTELNITHQLIADLLGVRREGVTEAAGKLQKLGIIECRRGRITVLDRTKLEKLSCECYLVVKNETERLQVRRMR